MCRTDLDVIAARTRGLKVKLLARAVPLSLAAPATPAAERRGQRGRRPS